MKFAMSVWNDCISTVLDFSDCLLVIDAEHGVVNNRSIVNFTGVTMAEKTARLKDLDIQILLCGAVSRPMEQMIMASGIAIIPFLRGRVNDVLNAYFSGCLFGSDFMLPGCRRRVGFRQSMGRRKHGHGHNGWNNNRKE